MPVRVATCFRMIVYRSYPIKELIARMLDSLGDGRNMVRWRARPQS
jgi:hypothetical protein